LKDEQKWATVVGCRVGFSVGTAVVSASYSLGDRDGRGRRRGQDTQNLEQGKDEEQNVHDG